MTDREARDRVARVESLLERLEAGGHAAEREAALACVQALLDLYGEGLARMIGHLAEQCSGEVEQRVSDAFTRDELVSHLLILHGLHPEEVRRRVEGALDEVRPYLRSHGGNVELVRVEGGTVRLRLQGSCHGCPSSSATLRTTVEDAILAAAPEIMLIETDDGAPATHGEPALVPIVRARAHPGAPAAEAVSVAS